MIRIWLSLAVAFVSLCFIAWVTDFITLQGETTVYSVDCRGGSWQGKVCSGTLVPGDRFRFRALRAHEEVLFWTIGASGPSHKFSNCSVKDGRNWSCPANADIGRTIAHEMRRGDPVEDPKSGARPYRTVSKWRWILLTYGISTGGSSD